MWFPLFPLPNTVLLPGEVISLYIFEERYKALLEEIQTQQSGSQVFGIVRIQKTAKECSLPLYNRVSTFGTLAHLQLVQPHDDGSSSVLVVGGQRFRVDAFDDDRPYLQGQLSPWPLQPEPQRLPCGRSTEELGLQLLAAVMRVRPDQAHHIAMQAPHDPVTLCSYLAGWLGLCSVMREQLLATNTVAERLLLLCDALPTEATRTLGMLN